jgi:C4-dicarboxylate-specific signal transduction histidine kinase
MTNAIEALNETDQPNIQLIAEMNDKSNMIISVTDNGCGIEQEALSKVFIPFFTTKSDGSGIGLSLSRQIMRLHGGCALYLSGHHLESWEKGQGAKSDSRFFHLTTKE